MQFSSEEMFLFMEAELAKINKKLIEEEKKIKASKFKERLYDCNVDFEIGEKDGKLYFEFFT